MSIPLTITLLTPNELSVLNLPENCSGRFYLSDHIQGEDDNAKLQNLITIEGKSNCWVAKSSMAAMVLGKDGCHVDSLKIDPDKQHNFFIEPTDQPSKKYIVKCEKSTQAKRTFKKYYVEDGSSFLIGRDEKCDIRIDSKLVSANHARLSFDGEDWTLCDLKSSNGTYVNHKRIKENKKVTLTYGDVIYVMGVEFIVFNGFLAFNNPSDSVTTSNKIVPLGTQSKDSEDPSIKIDKDVPSDYYYRSPRFMREISEEKIVIEPPPTAQKQDDMPLIATIGPAITMGMASLFSGVMMAYNTLTSNGSVTQALPMLVMSISMLLGMCLWPVITKKYQNAKWMKDERKRQIKYRDYLDRCKEQIVSAGAMQSEILRENIIDTQSAAVRVFNKSRNLWERTPQHSDFLNVRLGIGTLPISAEVEFPKTPFSLDNDSLIDAIDNLKLEDRSIADVPIPFSLVENRIAGVIGKRERVLEFIKLIMSQIVCLHSYDEVKVVLICSKDEEQEWKWMKNLPHIFENSKLMRHFAVNLDEARSMSLFFEKLLAERLEKKQIYDLDEVAFVLIDYKGGGLAGAFDNDKVRLPHLAGTITNLSMAAINRSFEGLLYTFLAFLFFSRIDSFTQV